jgi:hypothetical protein
MAKHSPTDPRQDEARFLVIKLANRTPRLADLLVTERAAGRSWVEILAVLQNALQANLSSEV